MNSQDHCALRQWLVGCAVRCNSLLLCLLLSSADLLAFEFSYSPDTQPKAAIALIIDDLGNRGFDDEQFVNLPGPVTCAFLPHAAYTKRLAVAAHNDGKEVMLHLPMQTMDHRALDRGALTLDMSQSVFTDTVLQGLAAIPHVSGINNHMGSLLTRHPGHMQWLMTAMRDQHKPLFFVDSRTTNRSVARQLATEQGIPNVQRDVFLDVERDEAAITAQFMKLVEKAQRKGTAVGIGHPYPETYAVIERQLKKLHSYDLRLVSVSELIELKRKGRGPWQASLSH